MSANELSSAKGKIAPGEETHIHIPHKHVFLPRSLRSTSQGNHSPETTSRSQKPCDTNTGDYIGQFQGDHSNQRRLPNINELSQSIQKDLHSHQKLPNVKQVSQYLGLDYLHSEEGPLPSVRTFPSGALAKESWFVKPAMSPEVSQWGHLQHKSQSPRTYMNPSLLSNTPIHAPVYDQNYTMSPLRYPLSSHIPSYPLEFRSSIYGGNDDAYKQAAECDDTLCFRNGEPKPTSVEQNQDFRKFKPMLRTHRGNGPCSSLVVALKKYHQYLTVDDIYHYLCGRKSVTQASNRDTPTFSYKRGVSFNLFDSIINNFQITSTHNLPDGNASVSDVASCNLNWLERSFLAIKIILYSADKVTINGEQNHKTISRDAFYKSYIVMCHRLIQRNSSLGKFHASNIILGQAQFGKLIKKVHPDLKTKKKGKRGDSKAHFINLTWNIAMFDEELQRLVSLKMSEIDDIFQVPSKDDLLKHKSANSRKPGRPEEPKYMRFTSSSSINIQAPSIALSYSFADLSYTYSNIDVSTWMWNWDPERKQCQWARQNINMSLKALRAYRVDLTQLLANINAGEFSDEVPQTLSKAVYQAILYLMESDAPLHAYKHLYLIILISIFPWVIASDAEFPLCLSTHLRASINTCVNQLESNMATFRTSHIKSISIFSQVLRNMVSLSEMISYKTHLLYNEACIAEMTHDLDSVASSTEQFLGDISASEELHIQSVLGGMNAYNYNFVDESSSTSHTDAVRKIQQLAKFLGKVVTVFQSSFQKIAENGHCGLEHSKNNLVYQLFKVAVQFIHKGGLANDIVAKLPIPITTSITNHISNSMWYSLDRDFDTDSSNEVLRMRYIFSAMLRQYMNILAEVVCLSQSLA